MIAALQRPGAPALPAAEQAHPGRTARHLLTFTFLVVGGALLLQRFGIPAGAKNVSLVGPVGMAAAALGLLRGELQFSRVRLVLFLALAFCTACGLALHASLPSSFGVPPSTQSLLQFLVLSSFATLSFARPVGERRFFRLVTALLAVVAAAGLLQFAAQFAGLRLFSFRELLPERLLFEEGYNQVIAFGIGSLLKSNGFFLLEPSIFSQMMALGIAMEVLTSRRAPVLLLLTGGLLASGSGTGWIVLGSFAATAAFSLGRRGAAVALGTATAAAVGLVAVSAFLPELASVMQDRMGEIVRPGTSGHLRFITPFWVFGDVLAREPSAALFGIGAGVSERLTLPYENDVNTPVKIALEFGLPALLIYVCLLGAGRKSPVQRALLLPGLVLLLFTGGYQQFPPVLFPLLLILSIARLEPDDRPNYPDGSVG